MPATKRKRSNNSNNNNNTTIRQSSKRQRPTVFNSKIDNYNRLKEYIDDFIYYEYNNKPIVILNEKYNVDVFNDIIKDIESSLPKRVFKLLINFLCTSRSTSPECIGAGRYGSVYVYRDLAIKVQKPHADTKGKRHNEALIHKYITDTEEKYTAADGKEYPISPEFYGYIDNIDKSYTFMEYKNGISLYKYITDIHKKISDIVLQYSELFIRTSYGTFIKSDISLIRNANFEHKYHPDKMNPHIAELERCLAILESIYYDMMAIIKVLNFKLGIYHMDSHFNNFIIIKNDDGTYYIQLIDYGRSVAVGLQPNNFVKKTPNTDFLEEGLYIRTNVTFLKYIDEIKGNIEYFKSIVDAGKQRLRARSRSPPRTRNNRRNNRRNNSRSRIPR